MTKFKFLLFVALLVGLASIAYAQETRKGKEVSAKEAYELSEKCAKFAAEKFKQAYGQEGYKKSDDGSYTTTYSNHYNAKLNKCFMLLRAVHFPKNKEGGVIKDNSLWDIHENQEMATLWVGENGGYSKVTYCEVSDQACHSESEWNSLVKPYMEE